MIKKIETKTVLLTLTIILYLILSFIKLGSTSLWLDEIMSLDFCDSGFGDLFRELKDDVHAPAYYVLLHIFIKIGGITERVGRLPGVLAGAGAIIALFVLARELKERGAAIIAALLLACSPFFLEFSREVHPYSLSAFFSVLSWLYFIRIMKNGKRISILLYGIFSGLLLLTFYLSILVIVSQFLYFCAARRAGRKKRGILTAWIIGALIFSVWAPVFITQLRAYKIGHDVGVYFPKGIEPYHVQRLIGDIFLGTARKNPEQNVWGILSGVMIIPCLILILRDKKRPRYARFLVLWMFWGLILLFTALCLVKPLYLSRYMTMSAPFACLFLAFGIDRISGTKKYVLLAILAIIGISSYGVYLKQMPRENWRDPAIHLTKHIQPLDVIVTDHTNSSSCLVYYFKILGRLELHRNTFTFDQFIELVQGEYPFPDRTLWYLSKAPGDHPQLKMIRYKNVALSQIYFKNDFSLHSFKGKERL